MSQQENDNKDKPVIRVVDLVKRFGDKTVLRGVNLDIYPGETTVIMGGSGCGKTTLLKHMIALYWPDEGYVELFGRNLSEADEHELGEIRKRFGMVFQYGAMFNSMTVGQNVALPLQEHSNLDADTIDIMVRIKLELVQMREWVDEMPSVISGGQRKRAALARAIAMDPEVLFYDEPSAGLDPVTSAEIDQLMIDLTGKLGVTNVVVTHEMDSAFRIADRMAMLDQGRMLKVGPREEFQAIRDSTATGDETTDLIRQFLRGDSEGPLAKRRDEKDFTGDILEMAEG